MPRELPQFNTFPHSHGNFFFYQKRKKQGNQKRVVHIPMEIFLFYQTRKKPKNKKRVVCVRGGWFGSQYFHFLLRFGNTLRLKPSSSPPSLRGMHSSGNLPLQLLVNDCHFSYKQTEIPIKINTWQGE
jgi:hypothetical protein